MLAVIKVPRVHARNHGLIVWLQQRSQRRQNLAGDTFACRQRLGKIVLTVDYPTASFVSGRSKLTNDLLYAVCERFACFFFAY